MLRAIEVQEDQAPRRMAQVVDPRDRLLALVAALGQMDRRAQPVELVRHGAVIGVRAQAGPPRLDAQGLPRPRAGQAQPVGLGAGHGLHEALARHEDLVPAPLLARMILLLAVGPSALGDPGPRIRPDQLAAPLGRLGRQQAQVLRNLRGAEHGHLPSAVLDLDPQREAHGLEPLAQRLGLLRLRDQPGGAPVLDHMGCELHTSLHGQEQRLRGLPRPQPGEDLGAQGAQPGQPIGSADADDALVRQVHDRAAAGQRPLLPDRVAVVGGRPGILAGGLDGSVDDVQKRGSPHLGLGLGCGDGGGVMRSVSHILFSSAEACVLSDRPSAAMSQAQKRSPLTRPNMRVEAVCSLAPSARTTASVPIWMRGPSISPT